MNRALIIIAVAAAMLAAPATSRAYVHQQVCRDALRGLSGNPAGDDDVWQMGNYFWPRGWSFWQWDYFNRRSDNEVRQDVVYNTVGTTGLHRLAFTCVGPEARMNDYYIGWVW
jgi:hypothetical protein